MDEFAIWPLTRRMVALFTAAGAFVCPRCGIVNVHRHSHITHLLFRCRAREPREA